MSTTTFHRDFTDALMDADPAARPGILAGENAARFAIYRNNVHRGLGDALSAAYPAVTRLVGEDFFRAMAGEFFRGEAQRGGSLALYGEGFAEFVAGFPPAASVPYLADVARLERAMLEAMHAADHAPLLPDALAGHSDDLAALCLMAHPASRLVLSDFPVHGIWARQQDGADGGPIRADAQCVLVTRPHMDVQLMLLDAAGGAFARSVLDGETVGTAYEKAVARSEDFDVTTVFANLLMAGAFAGLGDRI